MKRCIVTYATGPHEELLDVALPTYTTFAEKHHYDLLVTRSGLPGLLQCSSQVNKLPPAWHKIPLLLDALSHYDEVVWFDCDLIVVDPSEDFPPLTNTHSLVRHFEGYSEIPNSGVWRIRQPIAALLQGMLGLEVFRNHGWWEQASLMTLMGYTVPPEGSEFSRTKCRCVCKTHWYTACQFMRLCWNSHPNYRAEHPRIVHCSYDNMEQRLEVMRSLVRDPHYNYPRYDVSNDTQ